MMLLPYYNHNIQPDLMLHIANIYIVRLEMLSFLHPQSSMQQIFRCCCLAAYVSFYEFGLHIHSRDANKVISCSSFLFVHINTTLWFDIFMWHMMSNERNISTQTVLWNTKNINTIQFNILFASCLTHWIESVGVWLK